MTALHDLPGCLLTPAHVVHLRTERLVMRRFTRDDVAIIVELDSDPDVTRFVGLTEPTTPAVVESRILPNTLASYDRHPAHGYWATIAACGSESADTSPPEPSDTRADADAPAMPPNGWRRTRRAPLCVVNEFGVRVR
jgi:hypothetical protein